MELAVAPPAGRSMLAGSVPGNRGIWVGILCELTEFALMFVAWAWFRFNHPEDFRAGSAMLLTSAGIANTVVLPVGPTVAGGIAAGAGAAVCAAASCVSTLRKRPSRST